jgi:4-amino-4-deoxy-L-arabinose transferase-like glycosyltransferase
VAAWLVIAHATITGILLVAGVLVRALQPTVVALVGALFGLAVAAAVLRRPDKPVERILEGGRMAAAAMTRALAAAMRWWPVGALAIIVLVSYVWRAVIATRLPVLDYDGFSYHLVTVDVWLQTREIGRVPQRWWSDGYPANGELMTMWLTLFTGSDRLATLTGLVAAPLAIVGTVGIARRLGANRPSALLAGLVLSAMPAFIALSTTTYVDGLAVAYLAGAWFLGLAAISAVEWPRRRALLVLTGLAIGLGAGTKGTLVLPLGILVLGLLVDAARRSPGRGAARQAAVAALLVGLPAVLMGGYWYIKNVLVFGNPVWPFAVGPFPGLGTIDDLIVQAPPELAGSGPVARIARSWFADPWVTRYVYDTRIGGFGVQWPVVLILGLAGVVLLVRGRRYAPVVLLVVPALVTLSTMPMSWWPRLTLFVPLIVLALAAVALTRLPRLAASGLGALVVVATTVSLWVATAHGNAAVQDQQGLPSLPAMIRLVGSSLDERQDLGFWRQCRTLRTIPPGSRVAWDDFNLLHAIAGPRSDRFALAPVVPTTDPANLLRQARDMRADYLLLHDTGFSLVAAKRDPAAFTIVGPGCWATQIVAVSPDARPESGPIRGTGGPRFAIGSRRGPFPGAGRRRASAR